MTLEDAITTFGYPGIALAAFLEGEVVAFMAGVLAHRGLFAFEGAALAVLVGAVLSDNAAFLAGRHAGRLGFVRRLLDARAAAAARRFVARNADRASLGCRFVYGGKLATAMLIGTTPIPWPRFALFDLAGAVAWSHLVVGAGYLAGQAIETAFGRLRLHWHLALAAGIALLAAGTLAVLIRRSRR